MNDDERYTRTTKNEIMMIDHNLASHEICFKIHDSIATMILFGTSDDCKK